MTPDHTNQAFKEIVATLDTPTAAPAEQPLPPGLTWRTAPDGTRYVDYTDQPTNQAPAAALHETRISGRAKDAALIATTSSLGVGTAATGIGWGLGMAGAHGEGLMHAAIALAVGTGSLAFLKTLLFPGRRDQSVTNVTNNITQNVTARPFGRATGGAATGGNIRKK